jgi:GntR family transcriptional repressor for pyruvate dehydrogenase complex
LQIRPLGKRSSLSSDIAQQLHDMIVSATLKPGDRLPGQRELAQQFGASMASVREALSALAAAGLIDAKPGRGTVVLGMTDSNPQFHGWLGAAGSDADVADLLETRRLLESFLIRRVAQRATPDDVARLRGLLAQMENAVRDPEAYLEADLGFHMGVAEVAGNRVLVRIMRAIQAPMKWQIFQSNIRHMSRVGHLEISFETHVRLVAAIEQHDTAAAVQCLEEMLARANRLINEREER